MRRRQTDTSRASGVIGRNVVSILLIVTMVLGVAAAFGAWGAKDLPPVWFGSDTGQQWTQIGTPPVVYDRPRALKLLSTGLDERAATRIEVLDSGLIAGRGIVAIPMEKAFADKQCRDGLVRLVVADAWEGLYEYFVSRPSTDPPTDPPCTDIPRPRKLPDIEVCPSNVCDDVDHRGVASFPGDGDRQDRLVIADAHQRRLSIRDLMGNLVGTVGGARLFPGVTAVAHGGGGLFYVTTVPSETERSLEPNDPRRTGGQLLQVSIGAWTSIAEDLERPVGVAYASCHSRIYVTDATEAQTVWYYYEPKDEGWERAGVLATEPADRGATPPVVQGIAIANCGSEPTPDGGEIFAAGPGGLYVYRPDGTLIARYVLSERISGLAWGGDRALYMTIGHRIARLITKVQ